MFGAYYRLHFLNVSNFLFRLKHKTSVVSTQNLTRRRMTWEKRKKNRKKNDQQRGALRIEIREMDEHSAARGHLYYLLTLKIIIYF